MYEFVAGQRCISDAELQMGLGTIVTVEFRHLTVLFLATGETRTYAKDTAPLTRVEFAVGDTITIHDGDAVKVTEVREAENLLTYIGTDSSGKTVEVEEGQLDNFLQLNRPSERLFNGQIDQDKWFELRYQTLQHVNRLAHSELYGLSGCRTSLIPHQLYIAHEIAHRYAPRVLLADEVGLGKTIEAGLILHHQLLTERARRVLIVVPETLVHQWLVEMLRRFNLHFRIFDDARLGDDISGVSDEEPGASENLRTLDPGLRRDDGLAGDDNASTPSLLRRQEPGVFDDVSQIDENPFLGEQLVLCSLEFLAANPKHYKQCLAAEWDMLVVDEAHHLEWSPEHASDKYTMVEKLATVTSGVLLLTATPEQLGKEGHFARLRLLDPDRFHDFDQFVEEENSYEPIAQVVEDLLNNKALTGDDCKAIAHTFSEGDNRKLLDMAIDEGRPLVAHEENGLTRDDSSEARIELVEHLLDRHGTGRVLFRNTRSAVKGFPERKVSFYPLPLPEAYVEYVTDDAVHPSLLLAPELLFFPEDSNTRWTDIDPRVNWLAEKVSELYPEKVLVIAASADTALDIVQHLKTQTGLIASAFHEGLSIVERDRAAAAFADMETGAQVLVCSEIGSEGRNFQFAHHMVLFDLPLNPDLLEQRIGRLDRIGQTETIQIHVPTLDNSAQTALFKWYHEALDAFEHTCPAGLAVYTQCEDDLLSALCAPAAAMDELVVRAKKIHQELTEALHRGRDRLLEYNSCRMHIARSLKERALEEDDTTVLHDYMENVYDCFAIDTELHSDNCLILSPTEHMINKFPGLPDDGMTVTYSRDIALSFEDAHYITWEHPLVTNTLDMVLTNEMGNTAVTAVAYKGVPRGTILLECLYSLEAAPVEALQTDRYLPPTMIRVVVDEKGVDHNDKLPHEGITSARAQVDFETANKIVRAKQPVLKLLIDRCEQMANLQVKPLLDEAHQQASETLSRETNRLKALSQVNSNVRPEEIRFFEQQLEMLTEVLDSATLRQDALRVIVAT